MPVDAQSAINATRTSRCKVGVPLITARPPKKVVVGASAGEDAVLRGRARSVRSSLRSLVSVCCTAVPLIA